MTFHHDGLLESLYLLFEDRLGHELYRPVGMDWFTNGLWQINDSAETARQYLMPDLLPPHDYPPLNNDLVDKGDHYQINWYGRLQRLVTLEQFRAMPFDIVIASLPQHLEPFRALAGGKGAKFIFQIGNNWVWPESQNLNAMASITPRETAANAIFYHQNFDTNIFYPTPVDPESKRIYSFVNCLQSYPQAWQDYLDIKERMEPLGWEVKAYGGQNPDGNINGNDALADKMREATFILHIKPGGDGYGHILHNAYSVGRPVITRRADYEGQLGGNLIKPGTYVEYTDTEHYHFIDPVYARAMGEGARKSFEEEVDFDREAKEVAEWITQLR